MLNAIASSKRIFWFYGLLIGALTAYAFYLQRNQERQAKQYHQVLTDNAQPFLWLANKEHLEYEIQQTAKNYPCAHNDSILQKAKILLLANEKAAAAIDSVLAKALRSGLTAGYSSWDYQGILENKEQAALLLQKTQRFYTHLRSLGQFDPRINKAVEAVLPHRYFADLAVVLTSNRDDQKFTALKLLQRLQTIATQNVLKCLTTQMANDDLWVNGYMPVVYSNMDCAQAGEVFSGTLWLEGCVADTFILEMKANGQAVPIVQGVGKVERKFDKGGTHSLTADVTVRHPILKQTFHYKSWSSLKICE